MGRRLGIVIGVNHYQDATFRPLQFAETDARAIAQWLTNPRGGKWVPSDVQLLLGAQASYEQVEQLITHVCVNVAESDDLVFIYFAGHGFLDEQNGEGHLALANTSYQQPTTALHLPSLTRYIIGRSHAAQVVVILDCFQTGKIWSIRRAGPYDSKPLLGPGMPNTLQQAGRMFLCSCRGNELAPETGERNLGMLAYRMIIGLGGQANDPATGQVTLQRLHAFLFNALAEQHRPQLFGQGPGPVILVGDIPSNPLLPPSFPGTPYVQPVARAQVVDQSTQGNAAATAGSLLSVTGKQQRQQSSMLLLRQAQQQMQNPGQALNTVEQVLQDEPTNVTALILKGQILGTVGRFQEALSVVEHVVRIDANNALAWSIRAALLTNMGQFLDALPAIERSIELDPRNPETYTIKATIMANLTPARDGLAHTQPSAALRARKRSGPRSFFIGVGIQILGLVIGIIGIALPFLQPDLPIAVAFLLESLGLALLCVNAARGSYLHGVTRLVLTFLTSLAAVGILGGLYKFGYHRILEVLRVHPSLLGAILFLVLWLALVATAPLLIAFGGFIAGIAGGMRRRRR